MGALAKSAYEMDVRYLGVCCGASPMLIREAAEAIGRQPEASRYSENMANHFLHGMNERLREHIKTLGPKA